MTWKTDCGTCRHACSQTVRIGDTAYGNSVEEQGCMMEDRMTDEEAERCDTDCPFWLPDPEMMERHLVFVHSMCDTDESRAAVRVLSMMMGFGPEDIADEAHRRDCIKKVGDMFRDPDYHDIMIEMVRGELEGDEW